MIAVEELFKGDEIVIAFAHLLSLDGDHIVMYPIFHCIVALGCHALSYLTFMVREEKVEPPSVNIKSFTSPEAAPLIILDASKR